jgi:hypothetical protein
MIIAVAGNIGGGKDTVADYLVNFHEFRRESFASSLKDSVAAVFGWDRTLLEGRTKQSREWRETRDDWWSERLNMDITPRWILQYWGTDVCRNNFHQDIWLSSLENRLRKSTDNIIITDCRFPNEFNAIQKSGGKMVRVKRGPDPEWFSHVPGALAGNSSDQLMLSQTYGIHESEWAWHGLDFDVVIDNNGTIDELYNNVYLLLNSK